MKHPGRRLASGLLALCLILTMVPVTLAKPAQEPNITRYIPQGSDQVHTIHWAKGITPPTMPGQLTDGAAVSIEEADFKYIDSTMHQSSPDKNDTLEGYYVSRYMPGNGWYDINKFLGQGVYDDADFCFIVSACNAMEWWMEQNMEHIAPYAADPPENPGLADLSRFEEEYLVERTSITQDPSTSPVYTLMRHIFLEAGKGGGFSDFVMDVFFNGYPTKVSGDRNSPENYSPNPAAGFFYPVFGKSILTNTVRKGRYEYTNPNFNKELDAGNIIVLSYTYLGPGTGHAITMWGAEYDENDQLCAVYITDSNDHPDEEFSYFHDETGAHLIGMIRYQAYEASNGITKLSTLQEPNDMGSPIRQYYLLTSAEEVWEHYEQYGTPLYPDGRAFIDPMIPSDDKPSTGDPGCSHEFVYEAQGRRIVQTCKSCSYRQWLELKPRNGADFTYAYGAPVKPYVMYASPNWNLAGQLQYYDNINAGNARVVMSCKGVRVEEYFTILQAPQQPPQAPQLASGTGTSITLQPMEGGSSAWTAPIGRRSRPSPA